MPSDVARREKSKVMFYEREIDYWDWLYLVEEQLDASGYIK